MNRFQHGYKMLATASIDAVNPSVARAQEVGFFDD
jgi:hypothetical protein